MKKIINFLQEKKLIFKKFTSIDIKNLGSRKKINIYLAVDLKDYYATIFHLHKKSRVLKKEVLIFMELHEKLEILNQSKINKKYIHIEAPLCSKAKALLQEEGWRVWHTPLDES